MTKKNITIYDIAREAGVSPATVSRILTGSTGVRSDKKERVMELIEKYHFQPNANARALSENRSRVISMVVAHTGNSYYNSVFGACEFEAYNKGYVMTLMNTHSRPEFEESVFARIREMRPEAVILCGGRIDLEIPDPAFLEMLQLARESTTIVVGSRSPLPGIPGIAVDHQKSMELGLRYLIEMGHKEIGFIYTGTPYYGTRIRLKAFRDILEKNRIPLRDEWMIHVPDYTIDAGREGVEKLMHCTSFPTALLGMNDMVSIGVLQGLLQHGFHVPEDISLLGFDDTYVTDITTPRLTSVGYDYQEYGRLLVDTALKTGDFDAMDLNQRIPVFLNEKSSCAPPRERI